MPDTSERTVRVNFDVSHELHKAFRVACIQREQDMKDVFTNFMTQYVELTQRKQP